MFSEYHFKDAAFSFCLHFCPCFCPIIITATTVPSWFFPLCPQVFFALMLTPLFKKSKHVGIVEFLATLVFGFVGLNIVLLEDFPKSFVWILSPLCQCSFLVGVAQVNPPLQQPHCACLPWIICKQTSMGFFNRYFIFNKLVVVGKTPFLMAL